MKITNQSKGTLLADNAILAATPWMRIKGLLGKKKGEFLQGQALILRPCNSIHTFFMDFAIDILFVDRQNKIVKAIPDILPFRLSPVYFNSLFVVELPAGTIQSSNTQSGDLLSLE